jgi:hypothetical protein
VELGLLILWLLALWLVPRAGVSVVNRLIRKRSLSGWTKVSIRVVLTLVVLIAPFVDSIYISYAFAQLCKEQAGYVVVKPVQVEGFEVNGSVPFGWLISGRYKFIEVRISGNNRYYGLGPGKYRFSAGLKDDNNCLQINQYFYKKDKFFEKKCVIYQKVDYFISNYLFNHFYKNNYIYNNRFHIAAVYDESVIIKKNDSSYIGIYRVIRSAAGYIGKTITDNPSPYSLVCGTAQGSAGLVFRVLLTTSENGEK